MSDWVVLKFGGTSVAGRSQWDTIARLAAERREEGHRVLLVLSAVAGTTDALQTIASAGEGDHGGAIMALVEVHRELAEELGIDVSDLLEEATRRLAASVEALQAGGGNAERAELMAVGEWLSTRIGQRFLSEMLPCQWVDAREALAVLPEGDPEGRRAWLSARCQPGRDSSLQESWGAGDDVLVTQGFVARSADGRTALLGRGGSDTSAALMAGRLGADRVEIWTDVPGLFTADPRRVPEARLIHRLDVGEALEMAAGGARVVHPRCLHAAAAMGTEVWIRDTNQPTRGGTVILSEPVEEALSGVKAVTLQSDMAVLLLENRDIRQQVGFLAEVFAEIERHGVSVDLVATSETTTTLAIHKPANHLDEEGLQRLVDSLRATSRVVVKPDACTINLVGRDVRCALARLSVLAEWLEHNALLMVSQSANDLCLSMLVPTESAEQMLNELHFSLVSDRDEPNFGPRWSQAAGT